MPELEFRVTGVEPVLRGLTPLLHFHLQVTHPPGPASVQALILHAQIQIQSAQRAYTPPEKERLVELFGPPERWGQTLRNRFWTHAVATVGQFAGSVDVFLPAPCTYDLNLAATKYFYALEGGDIPLLFLFSGSVFYAASDGRLQVQPISWEKECVYRMPVQKWQQLMEYHYPRSAWLYLQRDTFDRLYAYKRAQGLTSWEETVARLLDGREVQCLKSNVQSLGGPAAGREVSAADNSKQATVSIPRTRAEEVQV